MSRSARLLIPLTLLVGLTTHAFAQTSEVRFQRFEVALWPEYDQPAALVMYRGWLEPDAQLPTTVTLPIPSQVAAPSAVAKRGPGTGLLVAPYTLESGDGWNRVHLQTDLPEVRVEFYLNLDVSQPQRSFVFEWPGGPSIQEAAYEVMRPLGASEFAASPSSAPPAIGQDGLTYQREILGPISAGAPFFIQFSYTKNSSNLTASALQPLAPPAQAVPPPAPTTTVAESQAETATPSSSDSMWFVVLPIVFAAGLAAGWILLSTRKEKGP